VSTLKIQASRFLVAGFTTVAIDFTVYRLLVLLSTQLDIAKALGFLAGTVFAYYANRLWTFAAPGGSRRFLAFLLLYLTTLVINTAANASVLALFDRSETVLILAFLFATAVSATMNFLGMKWIVFRTRNDLGA